MKRGGKRLALIGWGVLTLVLFAGGSIATEVEEMWEGREENVVNKRKQQAILGNQWAQYATGAVMAPMIVVLPFATMVDVDEQYGQQAKSGGNYIRNFMGFFAILAIYEAIRRKKWRDFVLVGAFVVAYLGVVSFSGFSNSERFLLPGGFPRRGTAALPAPGVIIFVSWMPMTGGIRLSLPKCPR